MTYIEGQHRLANIPKEQLSFQQELRRNSGYKVIPKDTDLSGKSESDLQEYYESLPYLRGKKLKAKKTCSFRW